MLAAIALTSLSGTFCIFAAYLLGISFLLVQLQSLFSVQLSTTKTIWFYIVFMAMPLTAYLTAIFVSRLVEAKKDFFNIVSLVFAISLGSMSLNFAGIFERTMLLLFTEGDTFKQVLSFTAIVSRVFTIASITATLFILFTVALELVFYYFAGNLGASRKNPEYLSEIKALRPVVFLFLFTFSYNLLVDYFALNLPPFTLLQL